MRQAFGNMEREADMEMTDKQMQFIAWLITTATDKCQTIDEVREMSRLAITLFCCNLIFTRKNLIVYH